VAAISATNALSAASGVLEFVSRTIDRMDGYRSSNIIDLKKNRFELMTAESAAELDKWKYMSP
jgi:hypothetical protein